MASIATSRYAPAGPCAHLAGTDVAVLQRITEPGVNLSLWQRTGLPHVSVELSGLRGADLADARRETSAAGFDRDLSELLRLQNLDPAAFAHWRADLGMLSKHFFHLAGGRDVRFRLVTTDRDDCRRFHVDRTSLRLLCTYRGPGTEWLTDQQVDRAAQASGAPNEAIIRYGTPSHFGTFWVGVMKGDPGNSGQGLVHRSPPVENTGVVRVLFCMDC